MTDPGYSRMDGVTSIDPGYDHKVDPHYVGDYWQCYKCKGRLLGSAMPPTRPEVPWPLVPFRHKEQRAPLQDETQIDGLETTE